MSAVYINEKHEEGYKWSEKLLNEYQLQQNHLIYQSGRGGYLSVDGKRLLQHTKQSINELKNLRKKIIK